MKDNKKSVQEMLNDLHNLPEPLESYKTQGKTVVVVKNIFYYMRRALIGLIVVFIFFSFVFGENLFAELGAGSLMLLIAVVINLFFNNSCSKEEYYDIEFKFFENYLLLYRNKRYYTPKVTRRDFYTYRNISKVEYDDRLGRLDIHGDLEAISYNYNKDGSLPKNPSKCNSVKNTYEILYLIHNEDIQTIINLFKKYTNCKIEYAHEECK